MFVAGRDQLEEQVSRVLLERAVANFIDNKDRTCRHRATLDALVDLGDYLIAGGSTAMRDQAEPNRVCTLGCFRHRARVQLPFLCYRHRNS